MARCFSTPWPAMVADVCSSRSCAKIPTSSPATMRNEFISLLLVLAAVILFALFVGMSWASGD